MSISLVGTVGVGVADTVTAAVAEGDGDGDGEQLTAIITTMRRGASRPDRIRTE
jgi:hypothetical protein